ncbi:aa3-type cytochrome c oxidase subunit IV [Phenylobacterium sp.]|uniref:aa3-type cytochrome c oxidase subunit IV n=1 Tax=Phenylobacterium sp. TaxID=1871053 RepID=UPI002731B3D1|nr:aa3-type cytochrome c oxidase subunit IV [Phenylobacterium sp.]MDP1874341.1 aa3-type cytochrome c oxidase subunit IV [Phenylobacterium sp.]MDP3299924.1 aa3-type cytochrome c oxidase subunit IV [Phenylobacterium sp.]MDP3489334.1 aa3-type cytochrome c oxidase subunit IV [Phenylobacterium sp.]
MGEQASDYHRGEMEIQEQLATFDLFMGLTKWGSLAIVAVLLLFIVWFCTPGGFMAGLISAVATAVIGFVLLRAKPEQAH